MRTKSKQEIDYVEENVGALTAYEIKWNPKAKPQISEIFTETYSTQINVINKENFRNFI